MLAQSLSKRRVLSQGMLAQSLSKRRVLSQGMLAQSLSKRRGRPSCGCPGSGKG
jgi:hypothetical protein